MDQKLNEIVDRLMQREEAPRLSPLHVWDRELEAGIRELDWGAREEETVIKALMAGLYLLNDSLDASHSYAQQIEFDATGGYWHGLMHRMERDFGNSKYWFMQAGRHPAKEKVKSAVAHWLKEYGEFQAGIQGESITLLREYRDESGWTPSSFVDLITLQQKKGADPSIVSIVEQLQHLELKELLRHTLNAAGFGVKDE
ncbi:hypothetical protein ACX93W_13890 [Paenibacillus sp. CAU 1782]